MPAGSPADELTTIWQRVREELEASLPESTFRLWLEPLRAVSAQGSILYLAAPQAVRTWVERRYLSRVLEALSHQAPGLTEVGFVDDRGEVGEPPPRSLAIDPAHSFDRFVIGPGNRLAHSAALAVAELPGEAYNPLFLHGPPGLGKTHLLGAIAAYVRENHPGLNLHYTTAELFTSEFVAALRHSGPEAFKLRYRELDALLIDDVQVLEGKQRTEEEFVHTFNTLYGAGKQIVLSSDRPPQALSRLAERLRDRFQWGLQVEVEPPDLRTRIAVLWRLASASGPEPPEADVLREIATRVPGNMRLLEGAMTRVLAVASLLDEPLSPPLARRALEGAAVCSPIGPVERSPEPSVTAIQDAVCEQHRISRIDLLSPRRSPRIAQGRQLAMYMTRELTSLTLTQIAHAFNRDHTTVLHAFRAVNKRLEPGSETTIAIHELRNVFRTTSAERLAPPADISPVPVNPQP